MDFKFYANGNLEYIILDDHHKKKQVLEAPFSQNLLDFLYLDIEPLGKLCSEAARDLRKFYGDHDRSLLILIEEKLKAISRLHHFFIPFYMTWAQRLEKAQTDHEDIVALLPHKEISRLYSEVAQSQIQLRSLFAEVLDTLCGKQQLHKKLENYHKKHAIRELDAYHFIALTTLLEYVGTTAYAEVLYAGGYRECLEYSIREILRRQLSFKVCKNCGRYFPLFGYSNTEYCDRIIEGSDKTCKEAGALNIYRTKLKDPVISAYNRAYKRRFAWIKYKKTTKELFYEWSEQAREMRDKCLADEITLEEFEQWLDQK